MKKLKVFPTEHWRDLRYGDKVLVWDVLKGSDSVVDYLEYTEDPSEEEYQPPQNFEDAFSVRLLQWTFMG